MNKHIIILGIALLLLAVGLSGCTEQDEKSRFIGAWRAETPENGEVEIILTFYNNGSVKTTSTLSYHGEDETEWSNYEIKNGKMCGISQFNGNYNSTCFDYEFTNEGNRLTLRYEGVSSIVLNKI
ncbi:MAG: hypothetical protein JSW60_05995 [Thermoplasmatales archaeon]|nr:MAG: hypothetical protein JSW60_05995 [Thermoplasmatales archaeon]